MAVYISKVFSLIWYWTGLLEHSSGVIQYINCLMYIESEEQYPQ